MKAEVNDCISHLENHLHSAFAALRVSGEDFVYCPAGDLFSRLDDYCDELNFAESRPPLLVRGQPGVGKTALLANWLHRREHGLRHRNGLLGSSTDEFLFWHAVGCSRQSLSTNALIRRLILALQTRFELNRPLPRNADRLSWELPRFLELAAKKGRLVLVIDGVHRLRGADGLEDSLSWLPLELPPNVRIVLSVTEHDSYHSSSNSNGGNNNANMYSNANAPVNNNSSKNNTNNNVNNNNNNNNSNTPTHRAHTSSSPTRNGATASPTERKRARILLELERRALPQIVVHALSAERSREVVLNFLQNTLCSDATTRAVGANVNSLLALSPSHTQYPVVPHRNDSNGNMNNPQHNMPASVPGFLLFPCHLQALLKHRCGGNAQFLRLFLRALHLLCERGGSLWALFDHFIAARTLEELYARVLHTCEVGCEKTRETTQRACDRAMKEGGLASLRTLFPRHPSLSAIVEREREKERERERETHSFRR